MLAAVVATEIARTIFFIMLTSFLAEQFLLATGFPAARTQSFLTFAILVGVFRPVIGIANDRRPIGHYRRKNLLLLGDMLYVSSIVMLIAFPGPATAGSLLAIIGSFLLYGTGDALLGVGCDSLALDVGTTAGKKNEVKAVQRSGAMVGLVIGYVVGAFLIGALWTGFLVVIGIAIVIGTVLVLRMDEPPVEIARAEPVARGQELVDIPTKTDQPTLWTAGALILVTAVAGSLTSIQYEPFLIARYGNAAVPYYLTELVGAGISLAAFAAILASPRVHGANLGKLIIPSAITVIVFYICLPWLAPTLAIYLAWTTAEGTGSNIFTFAADRVFMDVVQGKRKAGTYQVFQWFSMGGAVLGNFVGGMLGMVLQYEILLVVSGLVDAGALAIYMLVLMPRLKDISNITRDRGA